MLNSFIGEDIRIINLAPFSCINFYDIFKASINLLLLKRGLGNNRFKEFKNPTIISFDSYKLNRYSPGIGNSLSSVKTYI